MLTRTNYAVMFLLVLTAICHSVCRAQGIRPLPGNPFYWEFRGQPTLLAGGSVDDDLFQVDYLDYLVWLPAYVLKASTGRVPLGCPDSGRWAVLINVID